MQGQGQIVTLGKFIFSLEPELKTCIIVAQQKDYIYLLWPFSTVISLRFLLCYKQLKREMAKNLTPGPYVFCFSYANFQFLVHRQM